MQLVISELVLFSFWLGVVLVGAPIYKTGLNQCIHYGLSIVSLESVYIFFLMLKCFRNSFDRDMNTVYSICQDLAIKASSEWLLCY